VLVALSRAGRALQVLVIGVSSDVTHCVVSWCIIFLARAGRLIMLQYTLCVFVSILVLGRNQRIFVGGIDTLADASQGS
jgi:hypothetical protein